MHSDLKKHTLSDKAVAYWRVEETISLLAGVAIFGGLMGGTVYWDWPQWLLYIWGGALSLCIIASIAGFCTLQNKYRHFHYSYDDDYFYIQQGLWTKQLAIIPFEKIQAVTCVEGGLLQHFKLATIKLQVIEKSYSIPALDKQAALTIQQQLATLTKQKEAPSHETITATNRV